MHAPKLLALLMTLLAVTASTKSVKVSFGDDDDATPAKKAPTNKVAPRELPILAARWAAPDALPSPMRQIPGRGAPGRKPKGMGGRRPGKGKGKGKGGPRGRPGKGGPRGRPGKGGPRGKPGKGGPRGGPGKGGPRGGGGRRNRGPKGAGGAPPAPPAPPAPAPAPAMDEAVAPEAPEY